MTSPNESEMLRTTVGLRPGPLTSEHRIAVTGTRVGRIVAVLGTIAAVLGSIGPLFGQDTVTTAIIGSTVAMIGIVIDALNRLAYIRSRGQVKAAALTISAPDASTP